MATVTPAQIDAATDPLVLQKMGLKLQAEGIDNAKLAGDTQKAHAEAMRAICERQALAAEKVADEMLRQASILDQGGTRRDVVGMLFKELVAGYMKGGTQTLPDSQLADAKADAQFLGFAMDEALKVYDTQMAKVPSQ